MKPFYTFFFGITAFFNVAAVIAFATNPVSPEQKEVANQWLADQPVRFLENRGQMTNINHEPVPFVLFKASAPGIDVYLTEKGLTYVFIKTEKDEEEKSGVSSLGMITPSGESAHHPQSPLAESLPFPEEILNRGNLKMQMAWFNMHLEGAEIRRENIIREGESREDFNYFLPQCPDGIYGVKEYEKITIREVYPGIDWILYNSNDKGFKYDFIVHPGANPAAIKLIYESEKPVSVDSEGSLQINTPLGKLTEKAPYSYIYETGKEIKSLFSKKVTSASQAVISFSLPHKKEWSEATLIIDPQLNWSTFYGGNSHDGSMSIDLDTNGNIFVAGYTGSAGFPVQLQPGAYNDTVINGNWYAFILGFTSTGMLNWASYYGGSGVDGANAIACDNNGNVYVTGRTNSTNFPIHLWAGAYIDSSNGGSYDAYIVRFTNTGLLTWSTYYGGGGNDEGYSIFCNESGDIYITGLTSSSDFNVYSQAGAHNQNVYGGGGNDAFILQFSNTGALNWATLYGGGGDDRGHSIFCDGAGNIYATGRAGPGFPTHAWPGAYNNNLNGGGHDAFILRFANSGAITWATYYGGNGWDEGNSITCDRMDNIYVTGFTNSANFSTHIWTDAYYQDTLGGGRDAFVLRFNDTGILTWSTFYGGSGNEYSVLPNTEILTSSNKNIITDNCGNIYI